jgi:hypothetical protein
MDDPQPQQIEPIHAVLYCYWLPADGHSILHAIGAELYQGKQLLIKARPIHCNALGDRVIKMHQQTILETFSSHQQPITKFQRQIDVILAKQNFKQNCPVENCDLNSREQIELL